MNSNPLLDVWQSYQALQDCFEIAKMTNKHPDRENLFIKTKILHCQAQTNAKQIIEQSQKEADKLLDAQN